MRRGRLSRLEKVVEPVKLPDLSAPAKLREEDDAAAESEMDPLGSPANGADDSGVPVVARSPESPGGDPAHAAQAAAAGETVLSAVGLRELFSQLEVRPTAKGGIALEAPPEAASTLAALFEGLARMLKGGAAGT